MRKLEFRFGERRGRRIALVLFLGFVLYTLVTCGVALAEDCSGTITTEEALSAEDARYKAQATDDFTALDRLLGPDLVYIHSSAAVDNKNSYIELLRSGTVKYRAIRRSDAKVRIYGCLAIITGNAEVDVTNKGENLTLQLRFHSTWAKRKEGVQFVSWQSTRVPPKP